MNERILIIDVETILAGEIKKIFSREGYDVTVMPGYPEALYELEKLVPDIVIMGYTSEESLEKCHYLYHYLRLPVILIGKQPVKGVWKKALLEAEAEFYIKSPLNTKLMVTRVKAILRRYTQPVIRELNTIH